MLSHLATKLLPRRFDRRFGPVAVWLYLCELSAALSIAIAIPLIRLDNLGLAIAPFTYAIASGFLMRRFLRDGVLRWGRPSPTPSELGVYLVFASLLAAMGIALIVQSAPI